MKVLGTVPLDGSLPLRHDVLVALQDRRRDRVQQFGGREEDVEEVAHEAVGVERYLEKQVFREPTVVPDTR